MAVIEVVYHDGLFGFVSAHELDQLIASERIVKFQRSGGWAYLGVDPMRTADRNSVDQGRVRYNSHH